VAQCVVGNYDNDERELQSIPEAATFFRMVVECGWYGLAYHPKKLGMLPTLQPGCSLEEQADFWHPIIVGWCPTGQLVPADHGHKVASSCASFARLLSADA